MSNLHVRTHTRYLWCSALIVAVLSFNATPDVFWNDARQAPAGIVPFVFLLLTFSR